MKTTMKKIRLYFTVFFTLVAFIMVILFTMSSCGGSKSNGREAVELSGAGATFPLPFYNVVFEKYNEVSGDQIAYGGIGSGGGVRSMKDGIVDFAGSDAFLSDEEMAEMAEVIHIPTCMGAVVLAYNLPGVDSLNLSGEVVANIFAGEIVKWNDARIVALNGGVELPDVDIMPVFRSDGSGTTFVFTDYLNKVSEMWKAKYGRGKSVNFPVGQAAKGNPGVAGVIAQTAYSIGYVGSEYAFAQRLNYATLQNCRGEMIRPTSESISAAASGEMPADTRTSITNADAAGAYPISCFTWILVYKEQNYSKREKAQAIATVEMLKYILSEEVQSITKEVHYVPLPEKAVELSLNNLNQITYNGESL